MPAYVVLTVDARIGTDDPLNYFVEFGKCDHASFNESPNPQIIPLAAGII